MSPRPLAASLLYANFLGASWFCHLIATESAKDLFGGRSWLCPWDQLWLDSGVVEVQSRQGVPRGVFWGYLARFSSRGVPCPPNWSANSLTFLWKKLNWLRGVWRAKFPPPAL